MQKEENSLIQSKDEPRRLNSKGNKPDTERKIVQALTHMWNLKQSNSEK